MEMVRLALFLLAALAALGQSSGRIAGRVVGITGDPVGKATVTLTNVSAAAPGPGRLFGRQPTIAETGDDGRFSFAELAPGQYTLRVERRGYATPVRFRSFSLEPGQTITDFIFKVTSQAVITGCVTDSDGDPLENAGVSVLLESYNRRGKQWVTTGSAITDSRGSFRISALPPGRYLVSAGARNYGVTTFYPGALNISGASAITVEAGTELSGIDLRVLREERPRFAVRGKAIMITGGRVARGQSLTIKTRDGQGGGGPAGSVREDGSFELKSVQPGTYVIQTLDAFAGSGGLVSAEWTDKGQVDVTVADRDLEDVLLAIRPAMTIVGTIKADGDGKLASLPTVTLIAHDVPFNGSNASGRVRENGSFEIGRLGPVLYDVQLSSLPPRAFVKSMRFAGRDVTHAPIDLTSGSEGKLEIGLSPRAASVSGTVKAESIVALWDKYDVRAAIADEQGAFHFDNLAPGDYRILAWEEIKDGLAEYAPFRELFESQATVLNLMEDAQVMAQVKAISSDAVKDVLRRLP